MSEPLAALLGLERQLRQAGTLAQLGFAIVNQTRSCIPYTQAVLLRGGGQTLRVVAASDIAGVDHTSPYVAWIERIARACAALDATPTQRVLGPQDFDNALQADWAEMAPAHLLWLPLPVEARDGETIGDMRRDRVLRAARQLPALADAQSRPELYVCGGGAHNAPLDRKSVV